MNKYFWHIIVLLIVVFSVQAQDSCKTEINVTTNVDSAKIFVNGELKGSGSITTDVTIGMYDIVVMRSIKEWGDDVITDSIDVNNCDTSINLVYNFTGKTLIKSTPDAAVVFNDSLLGYTPVKIPLTYKNVIIQKNNYEIQEHTLAEVPVQPNIQLDFLGMSKQEPFIKSTLFKVLIGSALAFGATAAYFKLEADKKFDKYLETRQNEYLDDTDKLDLYSGLAFGALQINFAALLYFFLTE